MHRREVFPFLARLCGKPPQPRLQPRLAYLSQGTSSQWFDGLRHVRSSTFTGSIYTFAGTLFTAFLLVKKVAHDFTNAGNFVIKIETRYSIDAAVQRMYG